MRYGAQGGSLRRRRRVLAAILRALCIPPFCARGNIPLNRCQGPRVTWCSDSLDSVTNQ
jgi:hypothetical protein